MSRTKITVAVIALCVIAIFLLLRGAHAAPLNYSGQLELRSPVWASKDVLVRSSSPEVASLRRENFEPSQRFLDLAGWATFSTPSCPLNLTLSGEHSFAKGYFIHENKMKVMLGYPLPSSPVTLFTYWERRFDSDVDRVFVGARVGFKGHLD